MYVVEMLTDDGCEFQGVFDTRVDAEEHCKIRSNFRLAVSHVVVGTTQQHYLSVWGMTGQPYTNQQAVELLNESVDDNKV